METIGLFLVVVFIITGLGVLVYSDIKEKLEDREKRNWLTKEEAEAFTGESGEYYLNKWKGRPKSILKGWNWAAAFFCVEWMAYRKMYFWSAMMIVGGPLLRGGLPVAGFVFLGLSRFLDDWPAIFISILIVRFIIGGMFGNLIYRETAVAVLKKSLYLSDPDRLAHLESKGGTNAIAPVIAVVVQMLILAAILILT